MKQDIKKTLRQEYRNFPIRVISGEKTHIDVCEAYNEPMKEDRIFLIRANKDYLLSKQYYMEMDDWIQNATLGERAITLDVTGKKIHIRKHLENTFWFNDLLVDRRELFNKARIM